MKNEDDKQTKTILLVLHFIVIGIVLFDYAKTGCISSRFLPRICGDGAGTYVTILIIFLSIYPVLFINSLINKRKN